MNATSFPMSLLGLAAMTGCLSTEPTSVEVRASETMLATDAVVEDIPAVDRTRYPDSVGYVYEGSLATIFWMQNEPRVDSVADLERRIRRDMQTGIKGEFLDSSMQRVDPVGSVQPSLSASVKRTAQSMRLMTQYAAVTSDYERALGGALHSYNTDPDRLQAISTLAAQVDTMLHDMAAPNQAGSLPRPAPPVGAQTVRAGKYFADAVRDHARANLAGRVDALQRAVATRTPQTYGAAFADVFYAQRDADLAQVAVDGLAVHHVHGILRGQPLDTVIDRHVDTQPTADRPMSVDQLSVINRVNLIASDASVSRTALVAALLLLDEDHRQGEVDAALSPAVIWQHVHDAGWLVSQVVRLRADGTTEAQLNELIATIVAAL
jgi:hypothetical protein